MTLSSKLRIGLILLVLVVWPSPATPSDLPISVLNNNPLNIKHNPRNNWIGQIDNDGTFVVFDTVEHGFRAGYIILNKYITVYKLNTIKKIIGRFSPPCENDTDMYTSFVAWHMQVSSNDVITPDQLPAMMLAMSWFEGGTYKYQFKQEQLMKGIELAKALPH